VLVADDSAFMRTAISRMIQSDPNLHVVATASYGNETLQKIRKFDPDVITLDIEMPKLDGLGVLRRLMADYPKPVIVLSALTQEGAEATLAALDLGAFDCIPKAFSDAALDILQIQAELISKIKAAAVSTPSPPQRLPAVAVGLSPVRARLISRHGPSPTVVAIGTSTGGPKALQKILPKIPADIPAGLIIVQHMPREFTAPFAQRLESLSQITVRHATHGEAIRPGLALLAPAAWHMTVFKRSATEWGVHLSKSPEKTLHRPLVDVMMLSAADVCGSHVMGVILTGMRNDGAQGMKAIAEQGGLTVGQDEASCAFYGMPRACAELGILDRVVPLSQIPDGIIHATSAPSQYHKLCA
jgi:two-component system, chemotaxis family, protein-glutamate methylesterase/glutaminase